MSCAVSSSSVYESGPRIEDELAALALEMEDLELIAKADKGKSRLGNLPDHALARDAYQREITNRIALLKDVILAHSVDRAIEADARLLAHLTNVESQAQRDRALAVRQSTGSTIGPARQVIAKAPSIGCFPSTSKFGQGPVPSALQTKQFAVTPSAVEGGKSLDVRFKTLGISEKISSKPKCCSCLDEDRADLITTSCEHVYCVDCLKILFVKATKDESLFPPRCCRSEIPYEKIQEHLSAQEQQAFEDASTEFRSTFRIYCSNPVCSKFIPGIDGLSRHVTCNHCSVRTCIACKGPSHATFDCPKDQTLQSVLALAKAQGWQRCQKCHAMVELTIGCNHMVYALQVISVSPRYLIPLQVQVRSRVLLCVWNTMEKVPLRPVG